MKLLDHCEKNETQFVTKVNNFIPKIIEAFYQKWKQRVDKILSL